MIVIIYCHCNDITVIVYCHYNNIIVVVINFVMVFRTSVKLHIFLSHLQVVEDCVAPPGPQ